MLRVVLQPMELCCVLVLWATPAPVLVSVCVFMMCASSFPLEYRWTTAVLAQLLSGRQISLLGQQNMYHHHHHHLKTCCSQAIWSFLDN